MKIDTDNPIPKYLQLKGILKESLGKQYQAGQKIPTEIELMNQYQVSRNTVRQAITELEQEGLLSKEQGRGTFFLGTAPPDKPDHHALIGVLTPSSSYIYSRMLQGINEIAAKKHYNIVLGASDDSPEQEFASLEQLVQKNIDGLLFEPAGGFRQWQESKSLRFLGSLRIPVVIMGWIIHDLDLSYVSLDDVEVGFRATQYLIKAGHTRIACVYPKERLPGLYRYQGYLKALETYGIAYDSRLDKPETLSQRRKNMDAFISTVIEECFALGPDRPTAFFFFNDEWALRSYRVFREAGLKVPDDVSIMGCDDFEYSELAEIPLTTIIHPQEKIGKWAAEILLDEIKHQGRRTPRQIIVKPAIAIRDSVKFL